MIGVIVTFCYPEPTGCLHGVGRNPSKKNKARFIATVLHPEDAKDVVIPEKKK